LGTGAAPGNSVGGAPLPVGASAWDTGGVDFASGSRRRSRGKVTAVVAVVTAAIVVAVVAVVNGSRPGTAPHNLATSPVAFVTQSAQRTLAKRTADVTLSGTIQADGHSLSVSGTGETNFNANAMALDLAFSADGHSAVEREILTQGNMYLTLSVDGKSLAQVTGGREWIQLPVADSASASLTGSDPMSSLSVLEQHGDTVRKLGTQIIGGVSCSGYAVTPSRQAMIAAVRKEAAKLGLPASMTNLELQLLQGMSPPTVTVYFDAQQLLRQMSVSLQVNGLTGGASGSVVMDFSHYGTQVVITAPAPSDTISYKAFLQAVSGQSSQNSLS
jgi:hypothetical protein